MVKDRLLAGKVPFCIGMQLRLLLLQLFASASGSGILTGSMIRGPRHSGTAHFLRVPLLLPEARSESGSSPAPEQSLSVQETTTATFERLIRHVETPETTMIPLQETTTVLPDNDSFSKKDVTYEKLNRTITGLRGNVTRLYPVAKLWEEERSETDIWSLLHVAYQCLFSGLHCFSARVYPMFKSYLGLSGSGPTTYPLLLPRTGKETGSSPDWEDGQTEVEEPRGLLRSRLIKDLLLGLLLAKISLLPWLGGLGIASGKALLTGFLSLGAAGAVAALDSQPNYYM